MAPSAQSFEHSHISLKALHRTVHEHTTASVDLTLPERLQDPTTSLYPYLDDAISILGKTTEYLYTRKAPWVLEVLEVRSDVAIVHTKIKSFEENVRGAVKSLHGRIDGLEGQVEEVKSQVEEVKSQVEEVKSQATAFSQENKAFRINGLRKLLDENIEPIPASVEVGNGQTRYIVAADFPETIEDFWRLVSNPSALARLAEHYSVRGWERWKRYNSNDTDATSYENLEDAVAAHRDKCLMILASTWGLQYGLLERPDTFMQRKRDEYTDDSLEPKRARIQESDHGTLESVVQTGPRVLVSTEHTWNEMTRQYPGVPESHVSEHLGWKVNSTPSTERRRFRVRDNNGRESDQS
ncbi:hypothetical protein K432DRAFT_386678 [Lepidopterella palustris CBS 459.81]|uniref:Uncharacterized protein n=1 Tax=Lepidopterella palustris CBS 459.81 TaxID=1314670 RepID=A0A8E2DZK8_9PEZI|nr:hypothetical protein K432DRAFT_386678 [Lepidopterella palustris CBS 459.81]